MNQEAFRKLLATPRPGAAQSAPGTRGSLLPSKAKPAQQQQVDVTKSEFKPRKIKKSDGPYRDRAEERRLGKAGDFSEVEAVLENFEKQHANEEDRQAVDEQRRYLGGDSEHTVLVKGLDFALLEQTRARANANASVEDDEMLEEVFREVGPSPSLASTSTSKKRTREDIVRELKEKRAKRDGASGNDEPKGKDIEEAKKEGKFKPIGFKPICSSNGKDGKEKNGAKKKKKRKVVEAAEQSSAEQGAVKVHVEETPSTAPATAPKAEKRPKSEPEPEPPDEDFDIFAGAGEYEGLNLDDEDDISDDEKKPAFTKPKDVAGPSHSPEPQSRRKWIEVDEPPTPPLERILPSLKGKGKAQSGSPGGDASGAAAEEGELERSPEPEPPARLAPLATSALPSIRDMLAADEALEVEEKRKTRREKKKAGGVGGGGGEEKKKVSAEAKLNRDYQKLKSYTEKKGKAK